MDAQWPRPKLAVSLTLTVDGTKDQAEKLIDLISSLRLFRPGDKSATIQAEYFHSLMARYDVRVESANITPVA